MGAKRREKNCFNGNRPQPNANKKNKKSIHFGRPRAAKRRPMSIVFHRASGDLHHQVAANYDRPPRYFIPDWDDLVDPLYNFATDRPGPDRQKHEDEVYAHEIYQQPNYDGLLVSMSALRTNQRKIAQIRARGIHDYTRFQGPIIGDCGAFGY